jgi:hypothetical protein
MIEVVEERSIRIEGVPGGMLERMEVIIPAMGMSAAMNPVQCRRR